MMLVATTRQLDAAFPNDCQAIKYQGRKNTLVLFRIDDHFLCFLNVDFFRWSELEDQLQQALLWHSCRHHQGLIRLSLAETLRWHDCLVENQQYHTSILVCTWLGFLIVFTNFIWAILATFFLICLFPPFPRRAQTPLSEFSGSCGDLEWFFHVRRHNSCITCPLLCASFFRSWIVAFHLDFLDLCITYIVFSQKSSLHHSDRRTWCIALECVWWNWQWSRMQSVASNNITAVVVLGLKSWGPSRLPDSASAFTPRSYSLLNLDAKMVWHSTCVASAQALVYR